LWQYQFKCLNNFIEHRILALVYEVSCHVATGSLKKFTYGLPMETGPGWTTPLFFSLTADLARRYRCVQPKIEEFKKGSLKPHG
jgi:hypothetical protein